MSTRIFLTSTGANTWTVPSDWNNSTNTIEVIGAGGGGSAIVANGAQGGGAGGYGKISNQSYIAGTSIPYTLGAGGIGRAAGTTLDGGNGGQTYWNAISLETAVLGSDGGLGGGRTGGVGKGTVHYNGGDGALGVVNIGGGGGGAAGLNGAGQNGNAGGAGGNADNNMGGLGGALNTAGGIGTEYDGSHGSGGGGGGGNGPLSGAGGNYGGGGGGSATNQGSSAGSQGLIIITYDSIFVNTPRYWVGGAGNWDAATTTHWSTSSGGGGGASVPTSSNDVIFDFNSGSGAVTITATATCATFNAVFSTVTLSMGAQTINLALSGTVWNVPGLAITSGTSTIKVIDTSSSAKTFAGSNNTYYNFWITGAGTGTYTITGSNTFNDFKIDTPPHTTSFQAGSLQRLETFTVSGTAGNIMTLQSTVSGSPWFLHKITPGTVTRDYLSLRDSHVS